MSFLCVCSRTDYSVPLPIGTVGHTSTVFSPRVITNSENGKKTGTKMVDVLFETKRVKNLRCWSVGTEERRMLRDNISRKSLFDKAAVQGR